MNLEPPQPPTAPAPAIRPTPPTPPRIDKAPFVRQSDDSPQVKREVTTPESQARDAVAHGSGALTKRTVERDNDKTAPANQTVTVIPPDAPLVSDTQSDYDRGQDVLREFREMDAREAQGAYNPPAHTSTKQERPVVPELNSNEGHGGAFWIFTMIFVVVAAFVIAKKFLFTDKPALTKAQLFNDSASKVKATADKVKPVTPPHKPAKLSPKKEDDKGKHFEIRV
ncbi:MAG: hypothetical protein J5497_07425 [Selenomonadaceae bacterium]|nr:hypothetical protein [Selenomonadaceae bacterium]